MALHFAPTNPQEQVERAHPTAESRTPPRKPSPCPALWPCP